MFIKPAPGRMVRWPGSMRLLSDQGENVPNDLYWNRLIRTGDVVVQEIPVNLVKVQQTFKAGKKANTDG